MAVPTNLADALTLLTSPSAADKITGQDVRDVVTWLASLIPANAVVVQPSGITSGVTDRAAIQAALDGGFPVYLVPGATYYRDVEFTGDLSLVRCIGGEATIVGVGSVDDLYVSDKIPMNASQIVADRGPTSGLPTVILFNGQSNMVAGPTPTFGYSELTSLLGADILGWGHTAAAWTQVVDGSCNARANHGGLGTGPGPGLGQIGTRLARDIADATGQTIRTYSLAYSGQPISYFLPASATLAYFEDGSQHGSLNNYNLLKSYVTAGGYVPQWYVWCQGEADAGRTPDAYYADLSTLWTALQADYPGIKVLIIGTIGDAQDRAGPATGTVTGVRQAQKRLADENPDRVFFVDNTDLRHHTAYWYLNHYYAYSGSYAGYHEVERRCFAKMRGEPDRPRLPAYPVIDHPQSVFSFDHVWAQRHSLGVGGVLASWQDDIGSDSLGVENGTPEHIASDPNFGGRTVIRFDQTASERLTESSITGSNIWTFVVLARVTAVALAGTPTIWQLETAPGTNRIAFMFSGQQHLLDLNGNGVTFTGPAICEGNVPHVYGVTYNGTDGTAKLYIDGVLVSSLAGLANVNAGLAAMRIRIGSYSGVGHFGGEMAFIGCKAGVEASADQMAAIHRGLRAEYGLETTTAEVRAASSATASTLVQRSSTGRSDFVSAVIEGPSGAVDARVTVGRSAADVISFDCDAGDTFQVRNGTTLRFRYQPSTGFYAASPNTFNSLEVQDAGISLSHAFGYVDITGGGSPGVTLNTTDSTTAISSVNSAFLRRSITGRIYEREFVITVQTTNATPFEIVYTTTSNTGYGVELLVTASNDTDDAVGIFAARHHGFKNVAGVLSVVGGGQTTEGTDRLDAAINTATVAIANSGTTIRPTLTGISGKTINWNVILRFRERVIA